MGEIEKIDINGEVISLQELEDKYRRQGVTISEYQHRNRLHASQIIELQERNDKQAEEIAELGRFGAAANARRNIVVTVDISGITRSALGKGDADKQSHVLARNVETIIRNNFIKTGTGGWDWCIIPTTVFEPSELEGINVSTFTHSAEFNINSFQ